MIANHDNPRTTCGSSRATVSAEIGQPNTLHTTNTHAERIRHIRVHLLRNERTRILLPEPVEWSAGAKCFGLDPEMFFPGKGGVKATADACSICYRCPIRYECALRGVNESYGIWGGTTERDRRSIRHTITAMINAGFTNPAATILTHWFDSETQQDCRCCRRSFPEREYRRHRSRGRCRDCTPQ